jgi:gamma-glutamylcyclotransferase (GGCT)/AIG2-like uncharacterized protein YtfP
MSQPPASEPICRFFVYGTLCRGQCRERCWPCPPLDITPAWTFGTLYDRHDYPAMRLGHDRVRGECWRFAPEQMNLVREVLDQVEGTDQPGTANLYDRVVVEVYSLASIDRAQATTADQLGTALAYHYAVQPEQDGFQRIVPKKSLEVSWPIISADGVE